MTATIIPFPTRTPQLDPLDEAIRRIMANFNDAMERDRMRPKSEHQINAASRLSVLINKRCETRGVEATKAECLALIKKFAAKAKRNT